LRRRDAFAHLHASKLQLLDVAFGDLGARTFADLGGVWHVDGGYSLYALERCGASRGVLVDVGAHSLSERTRSHPRLDVVAEDFRDGAIAEDVGDVDAVFHFDTLLHQAQPDWDEVLASYRSARLHLVSQPQWIGEETFRLTTLPFDDYSRAVTPAGAEPWPATEAELEQVGRDSPGIWQWAITDDALLSTMRRLGYELAFARNWGPWHGLEGFERHALLFARRG
jgi:hypothetical protein